mgnify:CR=1 FL=1
MFIRFQYILTCWHGSLIRTPFRSNIYFYVICCFFVFYSVFFLNLRRKFKLYFSVQCSQFRFQTFQLFFLMDIFV